MSLILTGNSSTLTVDSTSGITFPAGSNQVVSATNASNINTGTLGVGRLPTGSVIQTQWYNMGTGNAQGTNSTLQSTAFSVSFTPKLSTSSIVHICTTGMYMVCDGLFKIGRNGTAVSPGLGDSARSVYEWYYDMPPTTVTWIDTPATTSAITYNWWACAQGCQNSWAIGSSGDFISSWTIMEIAA